MIATPGTILFEHQDSNPMDHADINLLLNKASLPEFKFVTAPSLAAAEVVKKVPVCASGVCQMPAKQTKKEPECNNGAVCGPPPKEAKEESIGIVCEDGKSISAFF